MADNEVSYVGNNVIHYITDTMPGSSGSAVFNERFDIVALHHAGGWLPQPASGGMYFRNEGILISAILPKLPSL
jgi:V8-like Glu-specific endopeptidase